MNEDIVILTDKDEFEDHLGREISDQEWLTVKQKLNSNKSIWQSVDQAIFELIETM